MLVNVQSSRIDPCRKLSDTVKCIGWDRYTVEVIAMDNTSKAATDPLRKHDLDAYIGTS